MKTTNFPKPFNAIARQGLFLLLIGAGTFFTSCKQGEKTEETVTVNETQTDTIVDGGNENTNDDQFLSEAAAINLEEIELGRLAEKRATSKEVKEFGKMMVDGHTKSLNELKTLAATKGVSLPQQVDEKGKTAIDELTKADASFEKLYMDKMVNGHTETITKFEAASQSAADTDVKDWATKTLPDLKMHLEHAVMVQQKIN